VLQIFLNFLHFLIPIAHSSNINLLYKQVKTMATIWVNEQRDPLGLMYSCIASCDPQLAQECHVSFEAELSNEQKKLGWQAKLYVVEDWDKVPVNSLKLG
jgi:hypothetical protein